MYPAPSLSNYTADPVTDPTGPTNGIYHAARAQGGWCGNSRSAGFREAFAHPEFGDHGFSIRLVAEAAKP
jgi:hypothetical protein